MEQTRIEDVDNLEALLIPPEEVPILRRFCIEGLIVSVLHKKMPLAEAMEKADKWFARYQAES